MSFLRRIFSGFNSRNTQDLVKNNEYLEPKAISFAGVRAGNYDGDKFAGGFGITALYEMEYWTLRERSGQLFRENLYARGLIRRLITNEISTGLTPELSPLELIAGLPENTLDDWAEEVENRFDLWGKNPSQCDKKGASTFGALQRSVRAEAYIEGDVLVTLHVDQITGLPKVSITRGQNVRGGIDSDIKKGNRLVHGVEIDADGKHVAYHVDQLDGSTKRVPAWSEKTGRRIAWLEYGCDRRLDDVRGEPLLSIVLQSLKEIDRYRDSAQRKATINSLLAMFIKKGEAKMSSLPMTGGAMKSTTVAQVNSQESERALRFNDHLPGMIFEELQHGEEPIMKGGEGTDINFAQFEETIICAIAWANELPPEILRLSFSSNYSASQAAINEYKSALNRIWSSFGETFCTPIFIDWLIAENLSGKIKTPKLLDAWRDPAKQDIFGALTSCDWYGSIKPSADQLKQGRASQLLVSEGWSTNARESRITTGTKFSRNLKRLARENALKVEAMRPLVEFKAEFKEDVNNIDISDTN